MNSLNFDTLRRKMERPMPEAQRNAVGLLSDLTKDLHELVPEVRFLTVPSYETSSGRKWKLVATFPMPSATETTLFGVYIDADGIFNFDFYGEGLVECRSITAAKRELEKFFNSDSAAKMLMELRDLARAMRNIAESQEES